MTDEKDEKENEVLAMFQLQTNMGICLPVKFMTDGVWWFFLSGLRLI